MQDGWSQDDPRLDPAVFAQAPPRWEWRAPLRTDFARRQALVEIDVLTALCLDLTLEQLCAIYRIQFPVLQQYEADTWYDARGRVVFTANKSLTGVGFGRKEFEQAGAVEPLAKGAGTWNGVMREAPAGYVFARTVRDDTQPGGAVERTIEYYAPFTRCERERDYARAWAYFRAQYGEG